MPIARRDPAWRRLRPWLSAVAVVTLMLAAFVGPALAQERPTRSSDGVGSTRLRDPWVSARVGRPSTTIRFWVTYRDGDGSPPAYVRLVIDGRPRAMAPAGPSTHYRQGVRFVYATRLPVGRHRISFDAKSLAGDVASVRAGTVRIVARRSSGSGSSGDSAPSGGTSSGGGSTGDTAKGGSTSGDGSADGSKAPDGSPDGPTTGGVGPDGAPGAPGAAAEDPAVSAPARFDAVPAGWAGPAGAVDGDVGAAAPTIASPTPAAIGRVADGSDAGTGSSGSGGVRGRVVNASVDPLDLLGVPTGLFDRVFRAVPVMITTSGTVVVWAAFVFFGKRRRDGEPTAPDPVLAANAASGPEPLPVERLVPSMVPAGLPPGVDPTEAGLPRWRRPSLLQARKTDPLRTAVTAVSLTFADGAVEPYAGLERRRIRYRVVRLLDVPDDVRSTEIGILDQGDEVQVTETYGAYCLVMCPDGQEGWLHRMVLGDVIDDDDATDDGPDGIDEDVLAAFLATRAKSA